MNSVVRRKFCKQTVKHEVTKCAIKSQQQSTDFGFVNFSLFGEFRRDGEAEWHLPKVPKEFRVATVGSQYGAVCTHNMIIAMCSLVLGVQSQRNSNFIETQRETLLFLFHFLFISFFTSFHILQSRVMRGKNMKRIYISVSVGKFMCSCSTQDTFYSIVTTSTACTIHFVFISSLSPSRSLTHAPNE